MQRRAAKEKCVELKVNKNIPKY